MLTLRAVPIYRYYPIQEFQRGCDITMAKVALQQVQWHFRGQLMTRISMSLRVDASRPSHSGGGITFCHTVKRI
jgi:hypothetical protein